MAHIEFRETMSGGYRLLRGARDERPFSFTIRARSKSLPRFFHEPMAFIEGEIDAEGLADHRPLRGTLGLDVLRTGRLPYAFSFECNEGVPHRFEGNKTIHLSSLVESMTVLPGRILDVEKGVEVASAELRFDLRNDFAKFLRGFRLGR